MKTILKQLFDHQQLNRKQACDILSNMTKGNYKPAQVAAFISVYIMRPICVEELEGFRDALMESCVNLSFDQQKCIDLCGTGGDGKNSFNISTLASFVVAGAGHHVVKHGNYGVSSLCGSSNVLEKLGVQFSHRNDVLQKQLDKANICFLHAPLFHPAMKSVAPIRKELGVKTFFNMLGPLVNPAQTSHQLTGVFELKLARLYDYLLQKTKSEYRIIHSLDGYDEISLTGAFKMISKQEQQIISPQQLGLKNSVPSDLYSGNSIDEAATVFKKVLQNKANPTQKRVVLANAAMAIQCLDPKKSFETCFAEASESLESKKALASFHSLLKNQTI